MHTANKKASWTGIREARANVAKHAKNTVGSRVSWLRGTACNGLPSRESAEATAAGLHLCASCGAPAVPVDLAAERDAWRLLRGAK